MSQVSCQITMLHHIAARWCTLQLLTSGQVISHRSLGHSAQDSHGVWLHPPSSSKLSRIWTFLWGGSTQAGFSLSEGANSEGLSLLLLSSTLTAVQFPITGGFYFRRMGLRCNPQPFYKLTADKNWHPSGRYSWGCCLCSWGFYPFNIKILTVSNP